MNSVSLDTEMMRMEFWKDMTCNLADSDSQLVGILALLVHVSCCCGMITVAGERSYHHNY